MPPYREHVVNIIDAAHQLETELKTAHAQISTQAKTINDLNHIIKVYNSSTVEGSDALVAVKRELSQQQLAVAGLKLENEALRSRYMELQTAKTSIADENVDLREAVRDLEALRDADVKNKETIADANSRIERQLETIGSLQTNIEGHKETIADLNDKLKLAESKTNVANEATVFRLKNQVLGLDEQIARQADTIRELESRLAATKDSSYRDITDIRLALTHRENEIYKWKQKSTQATNLAEERECDLEAAKRTIADLNVQLTQAKRDFESAKLTNADLNVRLSYTDSCCTLMNSRIGELQDTVQRRDEEIYGLKEKFTVASSGEEKYRRDAEAAKLTIADLNARLTEANAQNASRAKVIDDLRSAEKEWSSALVEARKEIERVSKNMHVLMERDNKARITLALIAAELSLLKMQDVAVAGPYLEAIQALQVASPVATLQALRDLRPYTVIGFFRDGERYIGRFTAVCPADAVVLANRSTHAPLSTTPMTVLDGHVEVAF